MIQQIMVRNRPMMRVLPDRATMAVMSLDARPVTVMQPAMIPAIAQATATVMVPLPPASSASRNFSGVRRLSLLITPTMIAAMMDRAAAFCMV